MTQDDGGCGDDDYDCRERLRETPVKPPLGHQTSSLQALLYQLLCCWKQTNLSALERVAVFRAPCVAVFPCDLHPLLVSSCLAPWAVPADQTLPSSSSDEAGAGRGSLRKGALGFEQNLNSVMR